MKGGHQVRKVTVRITSSRRVEILKIASKEGITSYQKSNKKYCNHNIDIPSN